MKGLKTIRLQHGLTQADVAKKMKVTQSVIAMWERGLVLPSASKLPELADLFGCTIDALYGREPPQAAG